MKKWISVVEQYLLPPTELQMSLIVPGLYVGNYRDSKDQAQLHKFNITHIIAIHDAARKLHRDKHYLCVMASDTPDQNLSQYFPVCNDFIHAARLRGGNVLIHCLAGMSRSVTVAVAYIMSVTELSWKDALKVVRVGRSVANPNPGFQKQLQDFEETRLLDERRRLKERYPSLALLEHDMRQIRTSLASYDSLLESKTICEGSCGRGDACPTGMCRQTGSKRSIRRKSSTNSLRTPPSSPRQLPAIPGSAATTATLNAASSNLSLDSAGRRPRSSPSGFHSYTGSCPPSRSGSSANKQDGCHGAASGSDGTPTTPRPSELRAWDSPSHTSRKPSLVKEDPVKRGASGKTSLDAAPPMCTVKEAPVSLTEENSKKAVLQSMNLVPTSQTSSYEQCCSSIEHNLNVRMPLTSDPLQEHRNTQQNVDSVSEPPSYAEAKAGADLKTTPKHLKTRQMGPHNKNSNS